MDLYQSTNSMLKAFFFINAIYHNDCDSYQYIHKCTLQIKPTPPYRLIPSLYPPSDINFPVNHIIIKKILVDSAQSYLAKSVDFSVSVPTYLISRLISETSMQQSTSFANKIAVLYVKKTAI